MNTKPVTETEIENFAMKLISQCETHDQWLTIVRFGLGTLLENQPLLMDLIVREATKEVDREGFEPYIVPNRAQVIMGELGLKFVVEG